MERLDNTLKQKAKNIKWFFTDIDGTLTDGLVYYDKNGESLKSFSMRDGTGFFLLRSCGIKTGIITGENSAIVLRRSEKLKVDKCFLNITNKLQTINEFMVEHNLSFEEIAYIGDDINDYKLMRQCGFSVAVGDADNRIKSIADYVCHNSGGRGAFREAVEYLLSLKNINIESIIDEYL